MNLTLSKEFPEIKFSEGNHQYHVEGVGIVPSVTTILKVLDKPALMHWAARITAQYMVTQMKQIQSGKIKAVTEEDFKRLAAEAMKQSREESKKATDIGTEVHEAAEFFLVNNMKKSPKTKLSASARNSFDAFKEWAKEHIQEVVATELRLFHPKYCYTGTTDIIARIDNRLFVADIKTSKDFYFPEMGLQLAAYADAIEVMYGVKIEGIGIIRVDKTSGQFEWCECTDDRKQYWEQFKCLAQYVTLGRKRMRNAKTKRS